MVTSLSPKGARLPLLLLAVWTVAIWLTRIVNVAQADDLGVWATLWRLLVAIVFVELGVITFLWTLTGKPGPKLGARSFVMLALASVVWWPVRTLQLLADSTQDTAFKLVHSALALATIAAVAFALWGLRRARRGASSKPEGGATASA